MKNSLRIAAASFALAALAACGAKGPLFLPKNPPADETEAPGAILATKGVAAMASVAPAATGSVAAPAKQP